MYIIGQVNFMAFYMHRMTFDLGTELTNQVTKYIYSEFDVIH